MIGIALGVLLLFIIIGMLIYIPFMSISVYKKYCIVKKKYKNNEIPLSDKILVFIAAFIICNLTAFIPFLIFVLIMDNKLSAEIEVLRRNKVNVKKGKKVSIKARKKTSVPDVKNRK